MTQMNGTQMNGDDEVDSNEMIVYPATSQEHSTSSDVPVHDRSDSSDSNVSQNEDARGPLPLPRDHSYLVASHPLVVGNPTPRKGRLRFFDMAVLELFGVVLFPGSTIPMKLRDRSLIEYLGRQIAICRELPHLQSEVRLGILAYKTDPVGRRRGRSNREGSLIGRIGVSLSLSIFYLRLNLLHADYFILTNIKDYCNHKIYS
jgi:hypothetical protein